MKKLLLFSCLLAGSALVAATFTERATSWTAQHPETGIADSAALLHTAFAPCAPATAFDTTVTPALKAKKVRVWGTQMLPALKAWGLDVAEFDADAVAQGDIPDVVFVTQGPGYYQHDVEAMYRAAAQGVHIVTLSASNAWSEQIARRLGYSYSGVLTIGAKTKGGASFVVCPKLFAGFPKGARLDNYFASLIQKEWMHGMYMTGERCLMGLVDVDQAQVATAIAQYPVGFGAFTFVGPRLYENPNDPACKRLLLNLINLWEKLPRPFNLPCVYHPTPREGKPYFELNVPGERYEYVTQARPKDHIWHLGCFFSWKYINGANFWEPSDRKIGRTRVVAHSEAGDCKGNAILESTLAYELDGRVILKEQRTVKVTKQANGNYALDWTADFEAVDALTFTASKPVWNKEKGTSNGCGYAGLSARLARNRDFEFAYTNANGSRDARCYGDRGTTIAVAAKSKRTGETTHLTFRADKPTINYTLHQPTTWANDGFYFIAFPECFNETLTLAQGEKRRFHYVVEVSK